MPIDPHANTSQWLSATTADVFDQYTTRLASESSMSTSAAARPRPLFLRKAVGIIRVSEVGEREGEKFVSPGDQRKAIERIAESEQLRLVKVFEEMDVSAYRRSLARRPGLNEAVEMIERGEAEIVVACYFDRLFRKLTVQEEVLRRVEEAGGRVLAVDAGEIRQDTASRWLTSTMLGMVAEYHARLTAEKTRDAKVNAVARGIPPWGILPLGYKKGDDRRIHVDPDAAPIARAAWELRAAGAGLYEVRAFLREHGYPLSYRSVQKMLRNRFYLGELHYGKLVNTGSHEAIIDQSTYRSAQNLRARGQRGAPSGVRQKPTMLLGRQGLLRCGSCGGAMTNGGQTVGGKRYYDYRCSAILSQDCPQRPYVMVDRLEAHVVEYVRGCLAEARGRYTDNARLQAAEADVIDREQRLDAAVEALEDIDLGSLRAKLLRMRDELEAAKAHVANLRAAFGASAQISLCDWDDLSLGGQRAIVRALIKQIVVYPNRSGEGRGRTPLGDRVAIEAFEV